MFSREESKQKAIDKKIYRARLQAKLGHPSMKLKHPDWCRDASKGNYTMLDKTIKEACQKKQIEVQKFRSKIHAKQ